MTETSFEIEEETRLYMGVSYLGGLFYLGFEETTTFWIF